ncbi:DUF3228 domain-containing protein [Besnoitia besnoiti]|uniref:DUF3228 domain-containing protein n=1 Tax=Besnoitia besnoiti TaxID=94643 RepID=A0A2A9MBE9_BESBE|nr:DUF3228 domain-containing protein [Besnoitia besnoiti]PFH34544.1 DUF3228 domain-containing protein [Besnoitia besnoiti]
MTSPATIRGSRSPVPKAALPLGLDAFCFRQFDAPTYAGTRVTGISKEDFLKKVNEMAASEEGLEFVEGYAPFCRHIFVPNFVGALPDALPITRENEHLLRSGYVARRATELPVLTRWFPLRHVESLLKPANFLDLILYSREQLAKEEAAEKGTEPVIDPEAPAWSIISVKAQDEPHELPMAPITMLRNTLIEEGGSGVRLDREAYRASVAYWEQHAIIMDRDSSLS